MMKFYSNSLPSTTFNIGLIVTDFLQLTKFRLAISVVFSSLAGYLLAVDKIETNISPIKNYCKAEEYHQKYIEYYVKA